MEEEAAAAAQVPEVVVVGLAACTPRSFQFHCIFEFGKNPVKIKS